MTLDEIEDRYERIVTTLDSRLEEGLPYEESSEVYEMSFDALDKLFSEVMALLKERGPKP